MSKLVSYVLLGSVFLAYCGVETTPDPERSGNARLANSAGSDESAIEIMHQELRNWMFLVEQHVMLVPGLKIPGIVEPGHYFSPDYNDSLTNEQDLDLSVTYLMRRIRDGLWHAGYPLNNVHTWKPPVDYGVFDHQPVHYDRIVLNGQVHLWFRVERPDGTQLGVLFPTRVLRTDPLVYGHTRRVMECLIPVPGTPILAQVLCQRNIALYLRFFLRNFGRLPAEIEQKHEDTLPHSAIVTTT